MKKFKLAVIGLGYTGAPLAFAFAKKFKVVGYGIDENRVQKLKKSFDDNNQISKDEFKNSRSTEVEIDLEKIKNDFKNSINTFVELTRTWDVNPILMTQANRFSNKPKEWIKNQTISRVANLTINGLPMGYKEYKNLYTKQVI